MRKRCNPKIINLVLMSVAMTIMAGLLSPPESNGQTRWQAKATLVVQTKIQPCPPGFQSVAKHIVGGRVVDIKVNVCPATPPAPVPVVVVPIPKRTDLDIQTERRSWFRWGFGLNGYYMTTESPGPDVSGLEGEVYGQLVKLFGLPVNFKFSFAPGKSEIDGSNPYSLAEYVGLQYQPSEQFSLAVGGRHRVIFQQKVENINTLTAEAQMRLRLGGPLFLNLKGGLGSGQFPYMGPVDGYYPAGVEIPVERKAGDGSTKSLGLGLEIEF